MIEIRVTENEDSAHRSPELATRVWLVKTPEENDAVIVSFVDKDSEDPTGIWLYEPGAEPVELHGVTVEGTATEFEWATVTTHEAVPCHRGTDVEVVDTDYPGDVLVTLASRDAAVDEEYGRREEAESALGTAQADLMALVTAGREEHESFHGGTFQLCGETLCRAFRALSTDITP